MAKAIRIMDDATRVLTFYGQPVPPPEHIEITAALMFIESDSGRGSFAMDREGAKILINSLQKTFKL